MEDIKAMIDSLRVTVEESEELKGDSKNINLAIVNILDLIGSKLEQLEIKQEYLEENVEFIDDDLTDIQEELFQELSYEDLTEIEEEYIEVNCKNCDRPLFVESEVVENNIEYPCPFCNSIINKQ